VGGVAIVRDSGANAGKFVRGYRSADAAAANENCAFRAAIRNRQAHGLRKIGIIHGSRTVCSEIQNDVAKFLEKWDEVLLEWETSVIRSDCQAHSRLRPKLGRPQCIINVRASRESR
jgi:hypothetical protein